MAVLRRTRRRPHGRRRLTLAADAWSLRVRPVAADGRALGPAEVVVGWRDDPGLAALLLLAGAGDPLDR